MRPLVRFYALLALAVTGLSAGYAALVLYSAGWPEAATLRLLYDWQPRPCTQADYEHLRRGLAGLALVAGAAGLGLGAAGRREGATLGQELAGVSRGLAQSWRQLTPGQRRGARAGLAGLTALRLYYSLTLQAYDDATTYELFVRESWLAANAAYPLPNNHLLSTALDWLFYQVNPSFWWSTRLPVLLASTGATALWFLALLRRSNFRVAAVAVGLFCLPLESLYYAAVGRGYWLLVGLGAGTFFAVLALRARTPGRQRVAALVLVASGVLGLYAVPTHLLLLAPAYAWWALGVVRRRAGRPRALALLLGLGTLTALATGLLYAPLLLLSGPDLLLHHRYVAPLAPAEFWGYVVDNLRQPYQLLVWTPLTLAGLGALWGLVRRARAGRLPPALAGWVRTLGLPSAWLVLTPYLISVAQRSYPPERTLLYKAQYTCILLALAADWALRRARGRRWVRLGLASAGLAFGALQLGRVAKQEALWRAGLGRQRAQPGVAWLARQPAGPILAPEPAQRFVLRFYSNHALARAPWGLDARPRPGVRYRYVLRPPGPRPAPGGAPLASPPAFHGPVFDIFELY